MTIFQEGTTKILGIPEETRSALDPLSICASLPEGAEDDANAFMRSLFDRWSLRILAAIKREGVIRFADLRRTLKPVTQKVLTSALRDLENACLIKRKAFAEVPPRVEYSLTQAGDELLHLVAPLFLWHVHHLEARRCRSAEQEHI
jgi:DNA-binding HxlR family transcriptional regulator